MMKRGVTVCIPVFNECKRIERAIRSAAPQCDYLIVSDNASTDGTDQVCLRLLKEYKNMAFIRQNENIGALNNFRYLLKKVETEFVLFLGSHDHIDGNFIQTLKKILENNLDTEIAAGSVIYELGSRQFPEKLFNSWKGGELDTAAERVTACIFDRNCLGWASYGLFRTSTLMEVFFTHDDPPYGIDITLITRIAIRGKIRVSQDTHYYAWVRSKDDNKKSPSYMERITGHNHQKRNIRKMRDDFCRTLFGIYTSTVGISQGLKLIKARYRFMVRNGMFKDTSPDFLYYLIYIPVKLMRRYQRGLLLLRKTFSRPGI